MFIVLPRALRMFRKIPYFSEMEGRIRYFS
ncbi:hypothetical protein HNR23_001696 [Nocardiopsis mwathae]|uniref:Uncharacterized protein n=1 Tax=Nocardiopsis mwathae TaxID=1472723 RepID=A0A7X0D5F2_9ACTN|nr:hypothetical protein [Nocardiopsis mwathae]